MKQTQNHLKTSKISIGSQYTNKDTNYKSKIQNNSQKQGSQKASLDLKKINWNKSPKQAASSLQLLILLLFKTLKMSLQQILGLFTNQNKYLAHIIVKGINQNFHGVRQFYRQLLQNVETLKRLYDEDKQDTYACLYAIKPGFISKDQQVSIYTIQIFINLSQIYEWFISQESKCSNTLLLGFKRHQSLNDKFGNLLFQLIKGNQIDYFTNHYHKSFASNLQFLNVTGIFVRNISKKQLSINQTDKQLLSIQLEKHAVFQRWLQIAQQFYQSHLQDKLIVLDFVGQFMLALPQIMQKNQIILNSIRQNWIKYQLTIFIPLFNKILMVLQKLANAKSNMSRKIYNIIIDIFNDTYEIQDKRDYVVNGFMSLLSQFPNIPSDLFIRKYQIGKLNSSDFLLICQAIDISQDHLNLIKIGDVLKQIFFSDVIANYYLGNLIPEVVKKLVKVQQKQTLQFIMNLIKVILSNYVTFIIKSKSIPKNSEEVFFGKKKSLQKSAKLEITQNTLLTKMQDLTFNLCQKIIDIILTQNVKQVYLNTLKNYLLITNSQIKKNNFGTGNKKILNILQKKFNVTKQQQNWADQQMKQNLTQSNLKLNESMLSKRSKLSANAVSSLSRIQVPEKVLKTFDDLIAKRKREYQNNAYQQMKKRKQQEAKKIVYKKELQKMNLIKGGFGDGQAQLKEQGFWNKLIKDTNQISVYTNQQIEDVQLEAGQLIINRYNKLLKYFFFNYSNTMYSMRASNFDQNQQRKQTLSTMQVIRFLKQYSLIFASSPQQIQILVRQINVKIFHRKQVVNQLDFEGFQQFIRQFCLCFWSTNTKSQSKHFKKNHLTLPQLLINFFQYLKMIFKSKNESLIYFETVDPELENPSQQVLELNEKLAQNPNIILPEGYKKIIDKRIQFKPQIGTQLKLPQSYKIIIQVIDEIIHDKLGFHFLQPKSQKVVKATAKPFNQISIKNKDPAKIKTRALSTIIDRKNLVQSSLGKVVTKNDLSKGIKKAMLFLKNQDKIVGEQVAFTLQQMLIKVCGQNLNQQSKINKMKSLHSVGVIDPQKKKSVTHKRLSSVNGLPAKIQKSLNQIKKTVANQMKDIQKVKQQILDRKKQRQKQLKRRQAEQREKLKKKKQLEEKYYNEQRQKLEQKKKRLQLQSSKKQLESKKQTTKITKQKAEEINIKNVEKLKKQFQQTIQRKKEAQQYKNTKEEQNKQKMKRVRSKIQNDDKIITQIRKQTAQAIFQLNSSEPFKSLTNQYQIPLKSIFQYLLSHAFQPLTDRKTKQNQMNFQTWIKFNKLFDISPLIVSSKDTISIFKAVTKDKNVSKQYLIGLTYEQFLECLLRQCIKQKTIFGKIAQRIKQDEPAPLPTSTNKKQKSVQKVELKNQFQEDEQVDIKKILKQPDVRDDIIDHYGDISKFDLQSFKGFIYYLRMPFSKKGQQARIKQLIQKQKHPQVYTSNIQKLKQKLKQQYKLEKDKKKDQRTNQNEIKDKKGDQKQKKQNKNKQKKQQEISSKDKQVNKQGNKQVKQKSEVRSKK